MKKKGDGEKKRHNRERSTTGSLGGPSERSAVTG